MEKYLTVLLEWYSGEVGGEAFFSALARGTREPSLAAKWRKLAQLEQHVGNRLLSVLKSRGVPIPAAASDVQRGLSSAQPYARLSWHETLARLQPELVGYVCDYERAEPSMPEELIPLARFVTDHERAILEFVTRELDQNGHHSLEGVLTLLGETTTGGAEGERAP